MHERKITVALVGHSMPDVQGIMDWLTVIGVSPKVIHSLIERNPETLIMLAAKRCYNSFEPGLNPNVTKVRNDRETYFENILSSGHGSVLEHATFSFAIEGVTRVFTAEMNRHRAGVAISEASMRYIRLDDIPFWMPDSLLPQEGDSEAVLQLKERSIHIIRGTFAVCESSYKELCDLWAVEDRPFAEKKQLTSMFRRVVPMGVSTGGVWTLNARALRHVLELRSSAHAEEEIRHVAMKILHAVKARFPLLFGDFNSDGVPEYHKV